MNIGGFEIERKFLIAMPDPGLLEGCEFSDITQTYLLGEKGTTDRVRCRRREGDCEYTHTVKRKISNMRRREDETVIDAALYKTLLERADPARRPIRKRRYLLPHEGEIWELDVFPFWTDRAVLELELRDERQQFEMPPGIRLIREVTDDPRYTNAALSLSIPEEPAEQS